ncbi:MAG: DNA internalization-related competence protein ComEC/Rec2 [Pseudomonadota bacterium]
MVYLALQIPPQFVGVFALGSLCATVGLLLVVKRRHLSWAFLSFLAATSSLQLNSWYEQLLPKDCNRQIVAISGHVRSLPVRVVSRAGMATKLELEVLDLQPARCAAPKRVLLYLHESPVRALVNEQELLVGDRISAQVRLRRPWGMANPGAETGSKRELLAGIHAIGSVGSLAGRLPPSDPGPITRLQRLRSFLGVRLREELHSPHTKALASALALGDARFLSPDDWDLLRTFGITHMFVISGLHLAVVAGIVWTLSNAGLRLAGLFWSVSQTWTILPVFSTMMAASGYALLSGFSLPVKRALLMLFCTLAPSLWGRPVQGAKGLSFAAIGILIFDPFAILGASFWMSFGAVALILWSNLWSSAKAKHVSLDGTSSPWLRSVRSFLKLQAYLIAGMAPLSFYFFGSGSGLGAFANFLFVPLVTAIVVPLLLIAVLLLPFSVFASKLLLVPECLLEILWQAMSYSSVYLPALDSAVRPVSMNVFLLAMALVLMGAARVSKYQLSIALLLCAALITLQLRAPSSGSRVTLFDVGQGLAALVEHRNTRILIDTAGQFASGAPIARQTFADYLIDSIGVNDRGVSALDLLVISHEDLDHRGGEEYLRSRIAAKRTLRGEWPDVRVPEALKATRTGSELDDLFSTLSQSQSQRQSELCRLGRLLQWMPDMSLRVLSHPVERGNRNDRSCTVLLLINGRRFLFPGDISSKVERELAAYWSDELNADVLVAGHHGSATSSSMLWLKRVNPSWFLVSAGYANAFRHPAVQVRDRVGPSGAKIINTAERGAIVFDLSADGEISCRTLRHRWAPAWRWTQQLERC